MQETAVVLFKRFMALPFVVRRGLLGAVFYLLMTVCFLGFGYSDAGKWLTLVFFAAWSWAWNVWKLYVIFLKGFWIFFKFWNVFLRH
jgi:hypothetical protein